MLIYRMLSKKDWELNRDKEFYEPDELMKDGFIHFSFKHQLIEVANAVYQEFDELIVLEVDSEKLLNSEELKVEDLFNYGQDYPHLYGPLNISAIVSDFKMIKTEQGFEFKD